MTSSEFGRDGDNLAAARNSIAVRKSLIQQFASTEGDLEANQETMESMEEEKPDFNRPINLEEPTFCCSYPSSLSYKIQCTP